MDIIQRLKNNFPNTIKKDGEVFSALMGCFDLLLTDAESYTKQWTENTDIYEQTGDVFTETANFISYLEQYRNESDDAFKKRIRAIFVRNGDEVWGTPYDIKNVFREYFNYAQIFVVEDVNPDNLIQDGDFEELTHWNGIDEDETSNCHTIRHARFSKSKGVEIKDGGSFYQEVENDTTPEEYTVVTGDTYESISKDKYGDTQYAYYIRQFGSNPSTITGPVKASCNVKFSRKVSISDDTVIPAGFVVSDGTHKFVTAEECTIPGDDDAQKATVTLIFRRVDTTTDDTYIPTGTIIMDGNGHNFITTTFGTIKGGTTVSDTVTAIAENNGTDYNVAANTLINIVTPQYVSEGITIVTNPLAASGGTNGTNLSVSVKVNAANYGPAYNVEENTITQTVSTLPDDIVSLTNTDAATGGCNADVIQIPVMNTYFLHFMLTDKCKVQITDNRGKYWNPTVSYDVNTQLWTCGKWEDEEYTISAASKDTSYPRTATTKVIFSRNEATSDVINIPSGTIVSDSDGHQFLTKFGVKIKAGETTASDVEVEAIIGGTEYNVEANTITTIVDKIAGLDNVTNPEKANGGTDSGWDDISIPIIANNDVSTIKLNWIGDGLAFIDYVRFGKKLNYGTFSVIVHFESYTDPDAAALFPGGEDTQILKKHENASYYDNSFITGVTNSGYAQELYDDLLNYIRAVGVKAYLEIVNRDE